MKLSIVTACWSGKHVLTECARSLQEPPPTEAFEIAVVDLYLPDLAGVRMTSTPSQGAR